MLRWIALGSLVLLAGCERPPSADKATEWTPADHDRAEEQSAAASGTQAPPARGDAGDQLVEVTWEQNCVACHGPMGHGDGPSGPMVNAPDLTKDEWQAKVSDADIAAIITTGKNRMPKFDLPPKVVEGLVGRIRAMRGK